MKYAGIFITFCLLVLLVCVAGIGFLFWLQNPERQYRKGVSSFEAGNYEESIESLNEYLSYGFTNENAAQARYYLAAALDRKQLKGDGMPLDLAERNRKEKDALAMRRFIDVINQNSKGDYQVEAVIGYAEICRRNRRYDRFITTKLEGVLHAAPDKKIDDQVTVLLGWQYLFAGDAKRAMSAFLESGSELAKLGQAEAHFALGQNESAFRVYEDFFQFYPASTYINDVKASWLREVPLFAKTLQDAKKYVEAIQIWRRVVDFFPDTVEAHNARYQIGESYSALENWTEALKWYQAAFTDKNTQRDEDALYKTGLTYYELKQNVEAYRSFDSLVNQYPNSIYQNRARQWLKMLKKDLEYFQDDAKPSTTAPASGSPLPIAP